jgi:hypothetical protein
MSWSIDLIVFVFLEKKQKLLFSISEGHGPAKLGEADPGGLGACPQKTN